MTRRRPRFVLVEGEFVLLEEYGGWCWSTFQFAFLRGYVARTFTSRARADRARRGYGKGRWRSMAIVRVTR